MLSSRIAVLFLLLLAGSGYAAEVSDYLYNNESMDSVSYESFTHAGGNYKVVSLGGSEILLLKNGEIVEDQSQVENVIYNYYLDEYYPSEEEIDELVVLVNQYNESRSDGHRFPEREEKVCLSQIFIDGRVKISGESITCRNESEDELCERASMLMYQYLSSVTGMPPTGSYLDLYEPIKEFGFASHEADIVIANINQKFEEAETNRSKTYEALEYTYDSVPALENHIEVIENSLFGWTEAGSCDSDHWCLCPDMDINDSVLNQIEDKSSSLMDGMSPFAGYKNIVASINSHTHERVAFAETESSAAKFSSQFENLQNDGQKSIGLGKEATSHIDYPTLESKLDNLESLDSSIPSDIKTRQFGNLESDMESYERLTDEVENLSITLLNKYNRTLEAKSEAEAMILVLDSRDLDPYSEQNLEELENKSDDLDAVFRSGMSLEQAETLTASYSNLSEDAVSMMDNHQESPVYNAFILFRGFASDVNTGIADFVVTSEIAEPEEVQENSTLALGGFSFLVLLSFGAIALLFFLSVLVFMKFHLNRMKFVVMAGFLGTMGIIILFSGLLFMYLDKTSTDATLDEYLQDFQERNNTAVIVDTRSSLNGAPMSDCADNLASTFTKNNKSVVIYTLSADGCQREVPDGDSGAMTVSTCLDEAMGMESVFVLNYSSEVEDPKFSTIYMNKAEIRANSGYYNSCPLSALFKS
jgi:hypothetical protein